MTDLMHKGSANSATGHSGKCLCGAIQFEISGCLPNLYQCYCSLCQKQTGGSHNTATLVNATQFRWLQGSDEVVPFTKDTGFSAHHCPHCGGPVPSTLGNTCKYWIPVGLLDDKVASKVVLHLHLDSRAPWQAMPKQGHQFGTMPDFTTICSLLEP